VTCGDCGAATPEKTSARCRACYRASVANPAAAAVAALLAKIDASACMGDCCDGDAVRLLAHRVREAVTTWAPNLFSRRR